MESMCPSAAVEKLMLGTRQRLLAGIHERGALGVFDDRVEVRPRGDVATRRTTPSRSRMASRTVYTDYGRIRCS